MFMKLIFIEWCRKSATFRIKIFWGHICNDNLSILVDMVNKLVMVIFCLFDFVAWVIVSFLFESG